MTKVIIPKRKLNREYAVHLRKFGKRLCNKRIRKMPIKD